MKQSIFVLIIAGLVAVSAPAQVVIRGTESSDKSASQSQVIISTSDRDIVPLMRESKQTKPDANTERTVSVTNARLNDGSYFEWQRSTAVRTQVSPDVTKVSTDVVEKDRQGSDHASRRIEETVTKSPTGERGESKEYTRDSSGQLVLDKQIISTTTKTGDGAANTTRTEAVPDVNGKLVTKQAVEETSVDRGPNEKVITAKIQSVDHLTGRLAVTAEQTTSIRTDGNAKNSETVVRSPGRSGWQVSGRTVSTERTATDGSVTRETIEHGRSLYSTHTGGSMEPLQPQRKTVEREVHKPDGTTVMQRDVFRRDINGDWKPDSFSTQAAGTPPPTRPADKSGN